jgi:glycosyltransferase involved in cell wall biosynthesis
MERIPPYCGGAEQVAWIHAVELAKLHQVHVVTFGKDQTTESRQDITIHYLPRARKNLLAYMTTHRAILNNCISAISPHVIHCHMPNELSACLKKGACLMVSTIHDGVPENALMELTSLTRKEWLKFKIIRRMNIHKSDAVTCVSKRNCDVMSDLYKAHSEKFLFIPNPIYEHFFEPVEQYDDGYVLNFGRQITLKMATLLDAARQMPDTSFVFVGTGDMVRDHGLKNVRFVGFSEDVKSYIDRAAICVFPSLSENFPLVGLEAMARGKPVIATGPGFSEYINHRENGYLLTSNGPSQIKRAIEEVMGDKALRKKLSENGRRTAEEYQPSRVISMYMDLYRSRLSNLPSKPEPERKK